MPLNFQLWNELCELISKNPEKVKSLKVEPIIRQGIKRYTDQVGVLWNSLADYYLRSGHFEKVSTNRYLGLYHFKMSRARGWVSKYIKVHDGSNVKWFQYIGVKN